MTILSNVDYFKELSFYNVSFDKPKIKCLKNIDRLAELLFHDQLNIIRTDHAFSGYAMSYKVEIIDKKNQIVQLEASKSIGFKYQITVKVLLKKNTSVMVK